MREISTVGQFAERYPSTPRKQIIDGTLKGLSFRDWRWYNPV